jgi:hypothetical protein
VLQHYLVEHCYAAWYLNDDLLDERDVDVLIESTVGLLSLSWTT